MIAICLTIWLLSLAAYLRKRRQHSHARPVDINEFAKRVRYIRYLETVPVKDCDRHNGRKRLRGVLTLARLCEQCQYDLSLRSQY